MASMGSLAFTTAGARAGVLPVRVPAAAPRRRALVVRAQAEDAESATEATTAAPSTPLTAKPKAAARPGLWDALAFSGPAPERINGRLAMAGSGSGLAWFAATAAVLSVASLVPVLRGESAEGRSGGVMSADAELWNGRFAMLGLVALAVTEYITGAPFVNV
ncbi:hypothetical protein PVAP13_2KG082100 [Panicum virgatum]|uniref:Uncharacterized protein n=1 Tax=Panicum virgatum TaxID=38727 RepID=A0A8T0W2W3_PANVG|nr:hypothetical protein PVAP13_2KG082100 [Panicum virgatum]